MSNTPKTYLSYDDIVGLVNLIALSITTSGWKPDYIVGITRGGAVPAVMLSHILDIPMHSLKVSLRDAAEDSESNCWMAEDAFGYQARRKTNILIVDDINDTGATINWIKQDWPAGCLPGDEITWKETWHSNVKFATIVNNESSSSLVDFTAKNINKELNNEWIVFPWERQ